MNFEVSKNQKIVDRVSSQQEKFWNTDDSLIRVEQTLDSVDNFNLQKRMEETVVPVGNLCLFNFLVQNPDASDQEINQELKKIERLSTLENKLKNPKNPLPTIGIEIEVPDEGFSDEKKSLLTSLDIPHQKETQGRRVPLWEVNPSFSYSAQVQARMLQELTDFGIIPLTSESKINSSEPLSLHINIGVPFEIEVALRFDHREEVEKLNDVLLYAFSSPRRLSLKKTGDVFIFTGAGVKSSFKNNGAAQVPFKKPKRLELRAGEFSDYPTYRQLIETQRLAAMLLAFGKYQSKMPLTFIEAHLVDLWNEFSDEVTQHLVSEDLKVNHAEYNMEDVIQKLESSDIKQWARTIATEYSHKVSLLLKLEELNEEQLVEALTEEN